MKVLIYSKAICPYCVRAKQLLEREGIEYQEIDINLQPEKREEMIASSNGRTTVPQIFINGHHLGGCDDLFAHYRANGAITELSE